MYSLQELAFNSVSTFEGPHPKCLSFGREEGIIQFEARLWFEEVPFQTKDRLSDKLNLKVHKHVDDITVEREGKPKQNKTSQQMSKPYCY